jgi:hypothetical protein
VKIEAAPLPAGSLLALHSAPGDRTDCFTAVVPGHVALEAYVEVFYTSRGFLPERVFLRLLGRGASALEVAALARGESKTFAAWRVEARGERELLLADWLGRTRSWLMVEPLDDGRTRLRFGSGIVGRAGPRAERALFRLLLPVHAVYSRLLLRAAATRLGRPPATARRP